RSGSTRSSRAGCANIPNSGSGCTIAGSTDDDFRFPRRVVCATFVLMFLDHANLVPPVDGRQSQTALMVARGVGRFLRARGFAVVAELPLATGRRADIVGLGSGGDVWIVEIKSSIEDFRVDQKWPDYRCSCDRLFFASHAGVPMDIFPDDAGL